MLVVARSCGARTVVFVFIALELCSLLQEPLPYVSKLQELAVRLLLVSNLFFKLVFIQLLPRVPSIAARAVVHCVLPCAQVYCRKNRCARSLLQEPLCSLCCCKYSCEKGVVLCCGQRCHARVLLLAVGCKILLVLQDYNLVGLEKRLLEGS